LTLRQLWAALCFRVGFVGQGVAVSKGVRLRADQSGPVHHSSILPAAAARQRFAEEADGAEQASCGDALSDRVLDAICLIGRAG
jgi:hypothetical protein